MQKAIYFLLLLVLGNFVSILNKWKRKNLNFILESKVESEMTTNSFNQIFLISAILERLPNRIPARFNCYERALTGRYLLNILKIPNSLSLGVYPMTDQKFDKLHAWLVTDACDVCGFKNKEYYTEMKVYT